MPIRELKLPQDLLVLTQIIPPSFKYPENPEWDFAEDQTENLLNTIKTYQRFFPVVKLIQFLNPSLNNMFRGYLWEEDHQPVGLVNCMDMGRSNNWLIGNVAVLPEYRRRGIAKALVQAGIDLITAESGETVILDVISNNIPAYDLYKKLGFTHFSGEVELQCTKNVTTEMPSLPPGYRVRKYDPKIWQPRYKLAQKITPQENQKFEPVKESRYKTPPALRVLSQVIDTARGVKVVGELIFSEKENELIGWWRATLRVKSGGVNSCGARVLPNHPEIAQYMIQAIHHAAATISPGRRILMHLPQWQTELVQAGLDAEFVKTREAHRLGKILNTSEE